MQDGVFICVGTQLHAHPFKRGQIVDTILLSGLDVKTLFVVFSFEQIFKSTYLFEEGEVFLTLHFPTKEDQETTGLRKGVLTAAARVGGQWQM